GSPAPTYGWTPFRDSHGWTEDHCPSGGAIHAHLDSSPVPGGSAAGWIFSAPPDTRIAGYVIYRYARAGWDAGGGQRDYLSSYDDANPLHVGGAGQEYCLG